MNRISNATGLDGNAGFGSAGVVSADDAVMGAENRVVIRTDGATLYQDVAIEPGSTALYAAVDHPSAAVSAAIEWIGGASAGIAVALTRRRSPAGTPRRGIAGTFARSTGVVAIPADATSARLVVSGAAGVPAMFRPLLSFAGVAECWRPGPHLNPDLDLVTWPAELEVQRDGFELEPIALRKGFPGDAGVPTVRRVSAVSRRIASCELRLGAIARDVLDQFWRANHAEFWFVRPDNGDLCIAEWADDGDPRDSGAGADRRTAIKVLLRDS